MRRSLLGAALVALLLHGGGVAASATGAAFSVAPISKALAARMTGVSWRPGCPVPLRDLRVVTASYRGFDGRTRTGRIVVHRDVAADVLRAFRRLYAERFPIRRMVTVDAYGGSDFRSIEADNTSAFNCRFVDGTTRWSEHAYGRAIDLNPIENPYVTSSGTTSHPASRPYLRRAPYRPGMAVEAGAAVRAFEAVGWSWGGRWSGAKDYQHFSASGR
ncbi:M15 family metallopeptidase [Gaiella sp.]|uniref:M15 family metallopeptidase n=1 Tax=Gaiella sp. TaxID=2663207 RepID=UPI002C98413D|nr:M15 family metallopeptidase [Gaiella sp.]HWO81257.1 M15 family metallopeptidase [Gaiella sp.]